MTWNDFAKRIADMPEAERDKTAYYREPYDKQAEMFQVAIREAQEDLADPEGTVCVKKGEYVLE